MFNKGDKVSVLDEAINGVVLSVQNNEVSIETDDGFVMKFTNKELSIELTFTWHSTNIATKKT